ncbi:MAG: general secretion pathway protein GspB [Phycisphaerae bacterium]|nr:general secretion pathway protein GspB [Phycisphaerae bacterium]
MNSYFKDTTENQPEDPSQPDDNWQDSEPDDAMEDSQGMCLDLKKSKNYGIILLLAVCAVGIAAVYLVGTKQTIEPTAEDKEVQSRVDVVLAKLGKGNNSKDFNNTAKLVQTFYDYPLNQQVALDELQKNPFSRLSETVTAETPVEVQKVKKVDIQMELQKKISVFSLQAVIQAAGGAKCMINGEVLDLGQTVGEEFTITKIDSDSVTLESQGHAFKLDI